MDWNCSPPSGGYVLHYLSGRTQAGQHIALHRDKQGVLTLYTLPEYKWEQLVQCSFDRTKGHGKESIGKMFLTNYPLCLQRLVSLIWSIWNLGELIQSYSDELRGKCIVLQQCFLKNNKNHFLTFLKMAQTTPVVFLCFCFFYSIQWKKSTKYLRFARDLDKKWTSVTLKNNNLLLPSY